VCRVRMTRRVGFVETPRRRDRCLTTRQDGRFGHASISPWRRRRSQTFYQVCSPSASHHRDDEYLLRAVDITLCISLQRAQAGKQRKTSYTTAVQQQQREHRESAAAGLISANAADECTGLSHRGHMWTSRPRPIARHARHGGGGDGGALLSCCAAIARGHEVGEVLKRGICDDCHSNHELLPSLCPVWKGQQSPNRQ
jgi:hypothetical protein